MYITFFYLRTKICETELHWTCLSRVEEKKIKAVWRTGRAVSGMGLPDPWGAAGRTKSFNVLVIRDQKPGHM